MNFFKHLLLLVVVAAGLLTGACSAKRANYEELKKNGIVHEAKIVEIDSVKGECTYAFVLREKEYKGHCLQPKDEPFNLNQYILVLYLERDPSINVRIKDK